MLNIHDLSISFNGEFLFKNVAFRINGGDKVGLVGKNGTGKSTLLKILSGDMQPDTGTLAKEKEVRLGFLRQDIDFTLGRTVEEEAYQAFSDLVGLEAKMESITKKLATSTDYESPAYNQLMVDLTELTERYEILGGYNYKGETEKVLLGLGFQRDDFNQLTDTFSGGWRMRIELAKLLLQQNDVLLLDEPTNHLDIESIIWLEQFLKTFTGAVILVSHDKMFLDNVTNRTIELSMGRAYDYAKPYSKYLELRDEIRQQQLNAQKNQEREIVRTEKLIEKFRAKATKAAMAQSLIKKLDKLERIEVDADDTSVMKLRFPVSVVPGKVVLQLDKVTKSYGENHVLTGIDLLVERGDKIAFVGQNGQGKTTLAKIIVGQLAHGGTSKNGHNVQLGYFAQDQADQLNGEKTLLDTMVGAANESNRAKVRDILGSFLFSGDVVEKQVKVLSGGERNRLALAKLLLQPFNVLIMDEPTNHLDLQSKNVLKAALNNFEGTLILVSHDRDFLQGLANKVYEFKEGGVKEYLGDIDFYLGAKQATSFRAIEKGEPTLKEKKTDTAKNNYQTQKRVKSLKNKLGTIEKKITELEKAIGAMDHDLLMDYDQTASNPEFFDRYNAHKKSLGQLMGEWETLSADLEALY